MDIDTEASSCAAANTQKPDVITGNECVIRLAT
jgi:hypothetical protein